MTGHDDHGWAEKPYDCNECAEEAEHDRRERLRHQAPARQRP